MTLPAQWQGGKYEGKAFEKDDIVYYTDRGERVRSKSEKIIADKLYSMGIPYRYEYPLHLNKYISVYPDFTILKVETREEIYLEHFGLMDKQEYVDSMLYKLRNYEKQGIYLGVNLFASYESSKRPLNVKVLEPLLKNICV